MNNSSKEILLLLAYLYLYNAKYEKALHLLKALKMIFPDDPDVTHSLSFACLKNRDYQSALQYAEAGLRPEAPNDMKIAATLIKGKALWGLGKEEAAKHTFHRLGEFKNKEA